MTIGIDLSPLQSHHRLRGIGYTLINFINGLDENERAKHTFIFFVMPYEGTDFGNPLDLLNVEGLNYSVRQIKPSKKSRLKLPGRLNMLISVYNNLIEIRDLYFGDSRIAQLNDLDVFLQMDQTQSLPRKRRLKKILIIYDIIPYSVEWDYLWSYKTARRKRGFSRKAALRVVVRRWLYAFKIKINIRRADRLLAISEQTKQDFKRDLNYADKKINVQPLGVNPPTSDPHGESRQLHQYKKTSWGYMERLLMLSSDTPFVLFVGGADRRRKLEDLVTAFNRLRAQGKELKLVLAGDSMQGPANVATEEIQYALKTSSYLDDIIFMGFVNDDERDWLYKNALAFVFPSRYEGFGLPVLEAMIHSCPVISYKNGATQEVAEDLPIYVDNAIELGDAILKLMESSKAERDELRRAGVKHAQKYSWQKTASQVLSTLEKL